MTPCSGPEDHTYQKTRGGLDFQKYYILFLICPRSELISEIPCRWKSLPEIFLGMLDAKTLQNIFLYSGRPEYFRQCFV